jgi:hypothetical protein
MRDSRHASRNNHVTSAYSPMTRRSSTLWKCSSNQQRRDESMFKQCDLPTLHRLQDTARRVREMIHRRAVVEYHLAFGSTAAHAGHLDMCVIHNSMIARDQGKPWPEVNYDHMRRAAWLCEKTHEPYQLVNRWYSRKTMAG